MKRNRWLRPLLTAVSIATGVVGGFASAFLLWALVINRDPGEEAGAIGLIWLFSFVTVPLVVMLIRSLLFRIFRAGQRPRTR